MILTCPECHTSYTVKDGAIPPHGRNVRCASCKHSWHEPGDGDAAPADLPPVEPASPAPEAGPTDPTRLATPDPAVPGGVGEAFEDASALIGADAGTPPAAMPSPATSDASDAREAAAGEVAIDERAPSDGDPSIPNDPTIANEPPSEVSTITTEQEAAEPFAEWNDASYEEPRPPRSKLPFVIGGLILLVALLAAATYFLAPREWMTRAGLDRASADSPLKLMVTSQDRQKLASGNDLVSLSGRVINPTDATQSVPALQADLRNGAGKLVYSWTIAPPAARLAPRGSASFNAAELGVPAEATSLTLRWAS